ncbi:MAG: sialate O-acetylesterase [bacterium]
MSLLKTKFHNTVCLSLVCLAATCEASPRLATVFGDHQVLQRDMPVPIWGTATPGEAVIVTFAGQSKHAAADAEGRWSVTLDPMPACDEPRELALQSRITNHDSRLIDLLVGDVWLCAGPSGGLQRETERLFKIAASEIAKANHPRVRLLKPILGSSLLPVDAIDPSGQWTTVTPKTIATFPISWYFARELNAATGVPVGLIQVHSGLERPSEWQAWRLDPKNTRQAQTVSAIAERLPQDIAAVEQWLREAKTWKPGKPFDKGFPFPAYIRPEVEAPNALATTAHSAYNFNVAPFAGMGVRGVVFLCEFEKCSVGKDNLAGLIASWREAWGCSELPFLLLSQSQRQSNSPQVEAAMRVASSLPLVKVIPRSTDSDPLNIAFWRTVAVLAKEIPIKAGANAAVTRKWASPAAVRTAPPRQSLEAACVFGSNMVVQAGMKVPVWGWGEPGAEVDVSFAGQHVKGVVKADGDWRVELAPLKTSRTPAEMKITSRRAGQEENLIFGNALVGEVWGNSGQSNAGRVMAATLGFAEEKPKADWPEIRYLRVTDMGSAFPLRRARGKWVVVSPETAGPMPGQGYYFAKQLHQQLKTPVGIVNVSAGGSTIFTWTTEAALSASPKLKPLLTDMTRYRDARIAVLPVLQELLDRWLAEVRRNGAATRPMPYYPVNGMISGAMEARGGVLYNAMLHPIIGTALRGFLWNQGEADTGAGVRSETYTELMETMVADWRTSWGYEFSFYFVQMPARKTGGLTDMWEKQTLAMQRIPNCGMIVCNDIADGDVHPADKKNVGERLARLALVRTYGVKGMIDSSPFMKRVARDGSRVAVTFAPVGDGLKTRDGKPSDSWELAGDDGKFVPAQAEVAGDRVLIHADGVPQPVAVRLGWSERSNCNLANSAGLPAMPFSAKVE